MKNVGIIAEFNPFHNGHKYLLDCVRAELNPHAVVCIMSGNFVQRGVPAIMNKFERAALAVECGADLVLELPTYYAVNNAGKFALGGIKILKGLAGIDTVAFGSECGDSELLKAAANAAYNDNPAFNALILKSLKYGYSYPHAYESSFNECYPQFAGLFDDNPNNLLGREYIKASLSENAGFDFYTVKRKASMHSDESLDNGFASSSAIRKAILDNVDINQYYDNMPKCVADKLASGIALDKDAADRYFDLVRYAIINTPEEEIAEVSEVSEGLENKLKKAIVKANNLDELILACKSKRYTYNRISRILAQLVLGINKKLSASIELGNSVCTRVLAMNANGAAFLKENKKNFSVSVYTNINKESPKNIFESKLLELDARAADIYSIISGKTIYEGSDFVCTPSVYDI